MQILLGTTNPSKVRRFQDLLAEYDVEFLTLEDLSINVIPLENGRDPVENAVLKAKFYGQYFDCVICNDSGLYFTDLPLDDPRQPGLQIRRPKGMVLRDDEAMLAYYASLVRTMGGQVRSSYADGMAVYDRGEVHTFFDPREDVGFYLVDAVHPKRHPGWPLDSISVDIDSGRYFVDPDPETANTNDAVVKASGYRLRLTEFLVHALGLEKKP